MDIKRSDNDDTVTVTIYMDSIVHDFAVSDIYYDYNKSDLRPESAPSLDSLVNFMKDNPALTVEVYSYTDGHGNDKYNDELSQKRAQAVLEYLEKNGVDKGRMIAKGFGKKFAVAPNEVKGKDNPQGRQMNRRTEFRIVTDVPTRRIIFNSAKPGTMDQQERNLLINQSAGDDEPDAGEGKEQDLTKPGNRVNKQ
jgi:outer membrane protein OmpA-like peptidoglycan-associated protein